MNNMAKCNYLVSGVGVVIGGLIMQAAASFPMEFTVNGPGPGFWPFSLGAALAIAACVLLAYTVMNKQELSQQPVRISGPANQRVYSLMLLTSVFVTLINLLGFYPAAALLIPAVMYLMNYKQLKVIILTTVGTLTFIYVVFTLVLRTQLPQSIFM